GGTRLLLRKAEQAPSEVKLRGAWLGLRAPEVEEQHHLRLDSGEEILLATDGVFEQLDRSGPGAGDWTAQSGETLLASSRRQVEKSLADGPQKDDLTMVSLRRTSSNGHGDVPV